MADYNYIESSFHELIKGVTFPGRSFELLSNSVEVDLTGASIDIDFRYSNVKGKIIKSINEAAGITIVSASEGKFQIDSFLMDWPRIVLLRYKNNTIQRNY